jgi:anthranilate/para-aminobenzoate synthase component I/branched-subunit amino acid aminotransferase/4-amino-4-deoxychorismate lyase
MSTSTLPSPACHAQRVSLPWTLTPEKAALLVRDDHRPFAFIGRWAGGGALIGSEPVRVAGPREDPFALLDQLPEVVSDEGARWGTVGGGWFGWLGYELGRRIEPVGAGPPPPRPAPFSLAFYDHLLRLDADGRWWFEALWSEERDDSLRSRLATLRDRGAHPGRPRAFRTEPWRETPSAGAHALAVETCRTRIHAGDLFQANICLRLDSRLDGAPIDLFATAAASLRPDRAAFLGGPGGAIASLSPELFLERHGGRVRSAPIKGTRPRSADDARAAAQRAELERSVKDRAENIMIVDLVRNDLGRVCEHGSIGVEKLCQAGPHTGVWHLVSEVGGALARGMSNAELVEAAFPPGSVTGAPKIAAMNVIAELESTSRRLYTGAIGFASPLGGLELSVAIRTFEFSGGRAWLGVGGGIVADSDPVAEAAECVTKAAPLLAAIGAELDAGDATRPHVPGAASPPRRRSPLPLARPDPVRGVFETLCVAAGRPVALELHLKRLAGSVRELYGRELPPDLAIELVEAAARGGDARLRVDFHPDGYSSFELTPLAPRRTPVHLHPVTLPGGLGAHKWGDRRLLTALAADCEGDEPLLCDLDGLVLEAGRASVFIIEAGPRLATPPTDGRILPGVTRARVLELARELGYEVATEPIHLARLADAQEVFVTGALGGVEAAQLASRPARADAVTVALARALRADVRSLSNELVQTDG